MDTTSYQLLQGIVVFNRILKNSKQLLSSTAVVGISCPLRNAMDIEDICWFAPRVEIYFSMITSESKIGILPKTDKYSFYFMLQINLNSLRIFGLN